MFAFSDTDSEISTIKFPQETSGHPGYGGKTRKELVSGRYEIRIRPSAVSGVIRIHFAQNISPGSSGPEMSSFLGRTRMVSPYCPASAVLNEPE